jgi:hypothetical protein
LWTEHKPLRQQRHLAFISEFNVQMLYLPSLKNVVSNFFVPPPPPPEPSGTVAATTAADPVDFEAMAAEQNRCTETQCLLGSSSLKIVFWQAGAQRLVGDVSTAFFALLSLKSSQKIFLKLHNILHPGKLASQNKISSRFAWRGLSSDINTWARSCLHCQQSKTHYHARCCHSTLPFLIGDLLIFTLTWWDLYIIVITAIMFSLSLIAHPIGWKLFSCVISPWQHAHER